MSPEDTMTIGRQALEVTFMVSAPLLLAALATGLIVSIFQAATQINEMTLSFIPKLLVMFIVLVLAGPWMLSIMMDYMQRIFTSIPLLAVS
ncbi:MAG: flagellar biosynthesis protein FliQ [Nitrosomonas sp.]|nr:flagellar biosynthesis protein FliQ [Nitrosomonas sp.]MDP1949760.1 flagellar biosynthesis protein FliQ [Nitrosomonas sp.]